MTHVVHKLTGPITAYGGQSYVTSQTGTGSTFVMQTSPTITGTLSTSAITMAGPGNLLTLGGNILCRDSAGTTIYNNNGDLYVRAGTAGVLRLGAGGSNNLLTLDGSGNTVATGSSSATQYTSTIATGTAPLVVSSTTRVANLNAATCGNADTVTTNANLTGPITSTGNATAIASQTGTGSTFVMQTSPTISGNFGVDGGEIQFAATAGQTKSRLYSYNNADSVWLLQATTQKFYFADSVDYDRGVALTYTAGTTGAQAGLLSIGQTQKNNANFTHGITDFYTNGVRCLRLDASNAATFSGNVGIGKTASIPLDVLGNASIGGTTQDTSYGLTILTKYSGGNLAGMVHFDNTAQAGGVHTRLMSIGTGGLYVDQNDFAYLWGINAANSYIFNKLAVSIGTTSAPTAGRALDVTGSIGASSSISDSKGDVRTIPQNSQSAAYTTVLADAGKHLLHPSADVTARTFTIDSNANVAYPIGTAITFVNQHGAGTLTIAITTDSMYLAGSGSTGSRTLTANGIATALKVTATEWIISGTNLT